MVRSADTAPRAIGRNLLVLCGTHAGEQTPASMRPNSLIVHSFIFFRGFDSDSRSTRSCSRRTKGPAVANCQVILVRAPTRDWPSALQKLSWIHQRLVNYAYGSRLRLEVSRFKRGLNYAR
jgi:hypothetical protein